MNCSSWWLVCSVLTFTRAETDGMMMSRTAIVGSFNHSLSKRRKSNLSNNRLSLVWIRVCHVCKRPTNCVLDWKVRLHSESERKHLYGIFVVSIYCARNCSCLHIYSKLWWSAMRIGRHGNYMWVGDFLPLRISFSDTCYDIVLQDARFALGKIIWLYIYKRNNDYSLFNFTTTKSTTFFPQKYHWHFQS